VLKPISRVWTPLVGAECASWIARAQAPLVLMLATLAISWPIGIMQTAVSGGAIHSALSVANALVFPLLLVELFLWGELLRHRRNRISLILTDAGMAPSELPRILSPTRFVVWRNAQRLDAHQVMLALEGHFADDKR
jgi:hypothetical protein